MTFLYIPFQTQPSFERCLSFFPPDTPSGLEGSSSPPPLTTSIGLKMASPNHRYDDSDSDGGNFNPAPADLSDDEQQPTSPVESRNEARRSSQSRDDNDDDHNGEANGDSHSVNEREDNESEVHDDEAAPRKAPRDDDDDEEDDEEDEDEDEDDEDMPVREKGPTPPLQLDSLASTFNPPDLLSGLRSADARLCLCTLTERSC